MAACAVIRQSTWGRALRSNLSEVIGLGAVGDLSKRKLACSSGFALRVAGIARIRS
ncbi:hypothetical protein XFF6991_310015 [Xanthomonas phaseoli pv. phaseoli]|uniref:Uncharacterized protein n=1 Tax=Xanthomonas campestris pv. phaseoli TaxID=317013 RepID=A0A7Z7J0F8_XANCH|nr:hypothetical protein XFF6991_310015 [Xanthomonas phaseoli pv. phaseoli]